MKSGKKQLLFIHGGEAFSRYEDFLEHLRNASIDDSLAERPKRWTGTLRDELGDEWEVYMPSMPNKQNAKYEEWKIWFERYCAFLRDGAVLVGHSQGGYFLVKYLSENTLPFRARALLLLAAPIAPDDFGGEDGGDFAFDLSKLPRVEERVEEMYILHSKDDPVVPFSHAERYKKALPSSKLVTFDDKGHFLGESFPEFLKLVQDM